MHLLNLRTALSGVSLPQAGDRFGLPGPIFQGYLRQGASAYSRAMARFGATSAPSRARQAKKEKTA